MKKIKTNIERPEMSSEEINSGKNFDKLYSEYAKLTKPFYQQNWFIANSIIVAAAGIVVAVMLFNNNAETPITNTTTLPLIETPIQIVEETTPKPFVNPPLKGINVPFSSYKIQGNKAKTIQHSSGSLIKIPTNAFINKNGDVIKGNVEIKYREFKDIAEIFASGIPMNYNDKGTEFHFESAGMIEILAYQDGQPILINPKKKIDIEMTSDYAGTQYNLYSLDTTNREWVYEGKDKVIMKGGSEPKEVAVIENLLDEFTISDNVATTPEGNPELKSIKEEIVVIQKDIKKIKKTEPIQPAKASENRFIFDLDVDKNEFPEMVVYEGMEFEIGDENKNFSPTLTNKEWEDISLAKNKQGKYILTLSRSVNKRKGKERNFETDTETKKFIVYPVYEGKNYTDAMADFNEKFETYSKKLAQRKEDERIKKEDYKKKLAKIKAENKRREEEWASKATTRQKAAQTNNQIYRTFSVYKFGTYNCDSPVMWPKGQTVLASFIDSVANKLTISRLHLVEKNRNAVFTYYPGYTKQFKFNPNSKNFLIGVTEDNQLITFTHEQFKEISTNAKEYDFKMDVQPANPNNIKELKQCISVL